MKNRPVYVISIVSEMLGLHQQTLRQYERMGLISPSRTIGNTRLYSDEDIERLQFIVTLTKDMGVNLAGVEVILNLREQVAELQEQNDAMREFIRKNMQPTQNQPKKEEGAMMPSPPKGMVKIKIQRED